MCVHVHPPILPSQQTQQTQQVYDTLRGSRDPALWPDSYTLTALLRCLQARATQQQGQGGYHSSNNSNVEAIKEPYAQMVRFVCLLCVMYQTAAGFSVTHKIK